MERNSCLMLKAVVLTCLSCLIMSKSSVIMLKCGVDMSKAVLLYEKVVLSCLNTFLACQSKSSPMKMITQPFDIIFSSDEYPEAWAHNIICPIHKSGSTHDVNNYRGISLSNVMYKILQLFSMLVCVNGMK